jgi:hypothetical protein
MQEEEWSCGAAGVVNALKYFGIHVQERTVRPIADTTATTKCSHCKKVDKLLLERSCSEQSHWRCSCEQCLEIKREWKKECSAGTTEKGIMDALKHFGKPHGLSATEYQSESKNDAWQWLHGSLLHGRVVILCVDSWGHWVLAFGGAGDRVSVFDSYFSKKNLKENGVLPLTKAELMRRWWNGRKWVGKDKRLYAISVGVSAD